MLTPCASATTDYCHDSVQVRELEGSEKTPDLLQELFVEGTTQLIDCLPAVWDNTVE